MRQTKKIKIIIKNGLLNYHNVITFYNDELESNIINTIINTHIKKITDAVCDSHPSYFDKFSTYPSKEFRYYKELEEYIKEYKNDRTRTYLELYVHHIYTPRNVTYLLFKFRYTENIDNSQFTVILLLWLFENLDKDIFINDKEFLSILEDYFNKKEHFNKNFHKANNNLYLLKYNNNISYDKLYEAYREFFKVFLRGNNIISLINVRSLFIVL